MLLVPNNCLRLVTVAHQRMKVVTMPQIPTGAVRIKGRDRDVAAALALWERFEDITAWRRSRKGSLWRRWDGCTVSVFHRDRRYHWSIADEDEVTFSHATYGDEEEAVTALGESLGLSDL